MRIAYIAPYQGPKLLARRPSMLNLALAGNTKIELVAELLTRQGHDVTILSQGEVVENSGTFYPAFTETTASAIPVHYASAWPVRFVNGFWSSRKLLGIFKQLHRAQGFDAVVIYNLKLPQMACALHAMNHLGLPVVLEHEDDAFVDLDGNAVVSARVRWQLERARKIMKRLSGGIGVSPHLIDKFSPSIPRLLLRGVISDEVLDAARRHVGERRNIVAFSGTLAHSKGVIPLIDAWKKAPPAGWELHIAGHGVLTEQVATMAAGVPSIVLRGLLNRQQNAAFLCEAKIGINPHDLSETPGNVFAFKIIEYLAAGAHVITTPMGPLEADMERGVTYIADNKPDTIAAALAKVIREHEYVRTAAPAAENSYGPAAVAASLHKLLVDVVSRAGRQGASGLPTAAGSSVSSVHSHDG
jgi:glycosyltransferase involved in cell wall biosynthesis